MGHTVLQPTKKTWTYGAPGAVPGEVGGVVVRVGDVLSVVGVGRGLKVGCGLVARRRVEVVVDSQSDAGSNSISIQ